MLPGLTRRDLPREMLAGVTLVALAVPLNIGYAQIAGLPPTAGLYAMIVPVVAYSLVTSSRHLVASPDAAAAALVASSLAGLSVAGSDAYVAMAAAQAVICGVMFVCASLLELGFLANFLSEPILVGLVGGLALDILVSQVAKMLGIRVESGAEFVDRGREVATHLSQTNGPSVAIAAGAVAVIVVGRRLVRTVPWALLVLVGATVVVRAAHLERHRVAVLGHVDAGLPPLHWPALSWHQWLALVPVAAALTMVATAEGLLVARRFGERYGYPTDPNRDLLAFGLGNLAAGVTGGFALGASTSRTATMDAVGARSQLPSVIAAGLTLVLVLAGTSLLEDVPSPAVGAIVAVAVVPLLGLAELRSLWRIQRFEFAVAASSFLGAVVLGPIDGIVVAFVLALINLARRAARPAVDVLVEEGSDDEALTAAGPAAAPTAPGVVVLRFAAPLFFANAVTFADAVRRAVASSDAGRVEHLVLDLSAVTDIDVTGAASLERMRTWLGEQQVTLHYSRVRPELRELLGRFGLLAGVTQYSSNRAALAALKEPVESSDR